MSYVRETSAGYLTNWAARLFARAIERRLAGGNSGPMPVFFALQDGGAMTQKALALRLKPIVVPDDVEPAQDEPTRPAPKRRPGGH